MEPPSPRDTTPAALNLLLAGEGHQDVLQEVQRLERRILALRERQMRRSVLVESMNGWDDVRLVAVLVVIERRAAEGRTRAREVMEELALLPSVFAELPYERTQAAYLIARDARKDSVARLFLSASVSQRAEAEADNDTVDLPVGVRREAARGTDRFLLDRLLYDRDSRVIRALLDNPRIVERDVVKIAAMRPTRPDVLEVVSAHRRWSSSYRVRKALACNPFSPSTLSRRLLPTLLRQDLRHIVEAGVLPPDLQTEAENLLRLRRRQLNLGEEDRDTSALAAEAVFQLVAPPVDE